MKIPSNIDDMIKCADREVSMRCQVYAGRIRRNKMTQGQADLEIELMRNIRDFLKEAKKEANAQQTRMTF